MKYLFSAIFIGLIVLCLGLAPAWTLEIAADATFEYPEAAPRDPFAPLVREEVTQGPEIVEEPAGFRLHGITWNGRAGMALITHGAKDWLVSEGMQIEDMKVDRIDGSRGEVVLLGDEKMVILRMLDV